MTWLVFRTVAYVRVAYAAETTHALGILGTAVGANRPARNLRANFEGGNSITTLLDLPQAPTPEALQHITHIALLKYK